MQTTREVLIGELAALVIKQEEEIKRLESTIDRIKKYIEIYEEYIEGYDNSKWQR